MFKFFKNPFKYIIKKTNKKERLKKKVYVYNYVYKLFKKANLKY